MQPIVTKKNPIKAVGEFQRKPLSKQGRGRGITIEYPLIIQ